MLTTSDRWVLKTSRASRLELNGLSLSGRLGENGGSEHGATRLTYRELVGLQGVSIGVNIVTSMNSVMTIVLTTVDGPCMSCRRVFPYRSAFLLLTLLLFTVLLSRGGCLSTFIEAVMVRLGVLGMLALLVTLALLGRPGPWLLATAPLILD